MKKEYHRPIAEIFLTNLPTAILTSSTELPIIDEPVDPRAVEEYNSWED